MVTPCCKHFSQSMAPATMTFVSPPWRNTPITHTSCEPHMHGLQYTSMQWGPTAASAGVSGPACTYTPRLVTSTCSSVFAQPDCPIDECHISVSLNSIVMKSKVINWLKVTLYLNESSLLWMNNKNKKNKRMPIMFKKNTSNKKNYNEVTSVFRLINFSYIKTGISVWHGTSQK